MNEETKEIKQCPKCKKDAEYIEFECDEPFTAPAELRFKALKVWGWYSVPKQTLCLVDNFVHFKFLTNDSERLVKMIGFDREKFNETLEALRSETKPCEHTDEDGNPVSCTAVGFAVFSMFDPDNPIGYFCGEHCFENGACPGCHMFLAGTESFDFSQTGFCEDCSDEISEDCDDESEFMGVS